MTGNPSGWEGLGTIPPPSVDVLSAWHHAKGECKISHHHGPDTPPALPVPAHPSRVIPTLPQARTTFLPSRAGVAPATPLQGQCPCLAMGHPKLSPHVSREVTEAWGWGCPEVSYLPCSWPCWWDRHWLPDPALTDSMGAGHMHFKRKQLCKNT